MNLPPPLRFGDLDALAGALRAGEISSVALTRACLQRIADTDGRLGAFRQVLERSALEAAAAADRRLAADPRAGPLCGIPLAVKDLFDVAGEATMAGCSLLRDNRATRDARAVERLRAAGMVVLGKTHTVQFAYGGVGVNHDMGTPRNPWAESHHIAGGSSSGSAVAVAAGLAPAALGTDTGGSVRLPAALCGITGLKTTVGQISRAGVYALSHSLDSVGPLCRSAADAAALFAALTGRDGGDESTSAWREQDLGTLGGGVSGLRLALAGGVFWEDVDPEVDAAVRTAADCLGQLGARVTPLELESAEGARALNREGLVIAAEAYANNRTLIDAHFEALDPVVAKRARRGRDIAAHDYLASVYRWQALRRQMLAELDGIDAVLVPTSVQPALPLAVVDADEQAYFDHNVIYLRNTSIGNILNLCGVSVPCGFTRAGLPIGLMVYARPFAEALALRVAHAYQQVTDWHRRHPAI